MPQHKQWIVANKGHMLELSCAVEMTMRRLSQWLLSSRTLTLQEQNEITAGLRDIYALQKLIKGAPKIGTSHQCNDRATQDGKAF